MVNKYITTITSGGMGKDLDEHIEDCADAFLETFFTGLETLGSEPGRSSKLLYTITYYCNELYAIFDCPERLAII